MTSDKKLFRTQAELREALSRWEKGDDMLAPLTSRQRDSYMDLHPRIDEQPFPDLVSTIQYIPKFINKKIAMYTF